MNNNAGMNFSIIAAVDSKNGLGRKNTIPWHLKADMKYFNHTTTHTHDPEAQNAVIMGSRTWTSLPAHSRPLHGRFNVVLNVEANFDTGSQALVATSLDEALAEIEKRGAAIESVFICGGGSVYKQTIADPRCETIYLTRITGDFECDTVFPEIPAAFKQIKDSGELHEGDLTYRFLVYSR